MIRKILNTKRILFTISFLLILYFSFGIVNRIYAQGIVANSAYEIDLNRVIQEDQVLHFTLTTIQRPSMNMEEPVDPYHSPIIPYYHGTQVSERWVTLDAVKQKDSFVTTDGDFLLIREFLRNENFRQIYSAINHSLTIIPVEDRLQEDATETNLALNLVIVDLEKSLWDRPAWVIATDPEPASPDDFDIISQMLLQTFQNPYAADLDFSQIQWEYVVDRELGLVVSKTLFALTSDAREVLFSETSSYPEIISAAEADIDFSELQVLPGTRIIDLSIAQPDPVSDLEVIGLDLNSSLELIKQSDFPIFIPAADVLAQFQIEPEQVRVFLNFDQVDEELNISPSFFRMTDVVSLGVGSMHIYTLSNRAAAPIKAVIVWQGPISIVDMPQGLPFWHQSEQRQVTISGRELNVWVTSGGELLANYETVKLGVFAEVGETFIYLEAQNLTIDEALYFLESLVQVES